MGKFRFAIMGAGGIGVKFCNAVSLIEECEVCAVASKSMERAQSFAQQNGIEKCYADYEEMLDTEKPDCVYIAVTSNDHFRLAMMCIERKIPVLCEKSMFQNSEEALKFYDRAKEKGVFAMEAMWSRFLPAVKKVKEWVEKGSIGSAEIAQCVIGFVAPEGKENRYFNAELGGGVAKDLTVYAYELTTYILNQKIEGIDVAATWSDTGVDINNHISIRFEYTLADLVTSFVTKVDESMVIYGREGKIVLPRPHFASECYLYDEKGEMVEHFIDEETKNGFTYEIEEAIRCIKKGSLESEIVPWADTTACACLFDEIDKTA